jgi:hypothetical protein
VMIVVSFTARRPLNSDSDLVESEMLAAHRYGNRLRELERRLTCSNSTSPPCLDR